MLLKCLYACMKVKQLDANKHFLSVIGILEITDQLTSYLVKVYTQYYYLPPVRNYM